MIKYKLGATIPTGNYANLQPCIEVEAKTIEKAEDIALSYIQDLSNRFGEQPLKEKEKETILLKSFNENVEVEFDELRHQYFYKSNQLLSATRFVKQFYPKFEAGIIAKNCEAKWGVKANEIQSMWASNGNIAGEFGTIIHKTLEHYFNYQSNGETILKNTEKEVNPALPKHPFLKSIIQKFEKIHTFKGKLETEVFVSDVKNGRCGQIDRLLITGKKKCRIQDYKVNVDVETENSSLKAKTPFSKFPANKLTKYQIQMSFYANCLKQSGWKVEALDAYVYENKWKHYEFKVLNI